MLNLAAIKPTHLDHDLALSVQVQFADPFQAILPQLGTARCGYRQPLSHVLRSIERAAQLGIEF